MKIFRFFPSALRAFSLIKVDGCGANIHVTLKVDFQIQNIFSTEQFVKGKARLI